MVLVDILPNLVRMDAAIIPEKLLFGGDVAPTKMYEKAAWYAARKGERLRVLTDDDDNSGETIYWFYVLRQGCKDYKKVDDLLVSRYNALMQGERPRGLTRLESFLAVQNALHVVQYGDQCGRRCPKYDHNPAGLVCSCKGFRSIGICSHVLAVNHWLEEINLWSLLGSVSGEKRKKGGYVKGVRPALTPEHEGGKAKQLKGKGKATPKQLK